MCYPSSILWPLEEKGLVPVEVAQFGAPFVPVRGRVTWELFLCGRGLGDMSLGSGLSLHSASAPLPANSTEGRPWAAALLCPWHGSGVPLPSPPMRCLLCKSLWAGFVPVSVNTIGLPVIPGWNCGLTEPVPR